MNRKEYIYMKENIVDEIYAKMMVSIANGEWTAGAKIPTEKELAATFQASRSSIRQAISRLKALDLVESKRGSGTVLKRQNASSTLTEFIPTIMFEAEDNLQIFEFHKGIQIECAKLACSRYTDKQMEQLLYHFQQMCESHENSDINNAIMHDLQFHKVICEMSGNIMFVRASELIYQHLEQSFQEICKRYDYNESIVFHERLVAALKDRNPLFSAALMEAHQWDTYQKYLMILGQKHTARIKVQP